MRMFTQGHHVAAMSFCFGSSDKSRVFLLNSTTRSCVRRSAQLVQQSPRASSENRQMKSAMSLVFASTAYLSLLTVETFYFIWGGEKLFPYDTLWGLLLPSSSEATLLLRIGLLYEQRKIAMSNFITSSAFTSFFVDGCGLVGFYWSVYCPRRCDSSSLVFHKKTSIHFRKGSGCFWSFSAH